MVDDKKKIVISPSEIAMSEIELLPVFAMRDLKESDVDSLAESIKVDGLLNPLLVRVNPAGKGFQLISGHRRFMALKKIKANTAPVRIIDADDSKAFILALTENLERQNPNPVEEGQAFKRAIDDLHMTVDQIAGQVRMSPAWVSSRMRLLQLPAPILDALAAEELTPTHAEKGFLRLKTEQDQLQLLKELQSERKRGQPTSYAELERNVSGMIKHRERIEKVAQILQKHKDAGDLKYPKCPSCGRPIQFQYDSYGADLSKEHFHCGNYSCKPWHPVKGIIKSRETTLDGQVSARESTPKGETVVKVESGDHRSTIRTQAFFDHIAQRLIKEKAVIMMEIGENFDSDEGQITIQYQKKKLPQIPDVNISPETYKGTEYVTSVVYSGGGWGGNNDGVLEARKQIWALEKLVDAKAAPADIIRHDLERLVVEHCALSKGKELLGPKGTWTVKTVHRDYTVIMTDPKGQEVLVDEPAVRAMVKAHLKAENAPVKRDPKKKPPMGSVSQAGTCRVCGCTETTPCIDEDGDPCGWANKEKTLCTVCCTKQAVADIKADTAARKKKEKKKGR